MLLLMLSSGGSGSKAGLSVLQDTPLVTDPAMGGIVRVHDPSLFRQGATYYVFSTDVRAPRNGRYLPIRCSADRLNWEPCGHVFTALPAWVTAAVPGVRSLWAPDISYFGGLYHLYYAASIFGTQSSAIGVATNTTLDPADPMYAWVDRGQVLASHVGDDFNAIDPNILADSDGRVWLNYGSYWSGIKQREIDPATGLLLASKRKRYNLARRPDTPDDAIEGPSLVHVGSFYYLFVSVDHCCMPEIADDDYKQVVGRSRGPHGPFVDAQGVSLMKGGGGIVLRGNDRWLAPGGGTAYVDAQSGESLLVFHALEAARSGATTLWVQTMRWESGWPVLSDPAGVIADSSAAVPRDKE